MKLMFSIFEQHVHGDCVLAIMGSYLLCLQCVAIDADYRTGPLKWAWSVTMQLSGLSRIFNGFAMTMVHNSCVIIMHVVLSGQS